MPTSTHTRRISDESPFPVPPGRVVARTAETARRHRELPPRPEALEGRALLSLSPHLSSTSTRPAWGRPPTASRPSATPPSSSPTTASTARSSGRPTVRRPATSLVKDINPGAASSNIHGMTDLNGLLLFFADDGIHGEELWRSDGTTDGTHLVDDINPRPGKLRPPTPCPPRSCRARCSSMPTTACTATSSG